MSRVKSIICWLIGHHNWQYGRGVKMKHCRVCGKVTIIKSRKTTEE